MVQLNTMFDQKWITIFDTFWLMLGCKDENWFCQNQTLENHKKNVSNVNNNKKPDIHQTAKMLFFFGVSEK